MLFVAPLGIPMVKTYLDADVDAECNGFVTGAVLEYRSRAGLE